MFSHKISAVSCSKECYKTTQHPWARAEPYLGGGGTGLWTLKQSPWAWLGPWYGSWPKMTTFTWKQEQKTFKHPTSVFPILKQFFVQIYASISWDGKFFALSSIPKSSKRHYIELGDWLGRQAKCLDSHAALSQDLLKYGWQRKKIQWLPMSYELC